ncbi:MAG: trypsin-like peptidase domain-containing protein [Corynebacterium sp.]|nr:trypsin-like peptidase domain-containing protein [Corynebacterium sp.]
MTDANESLFPKKDAQKDEVPENTETAQESESPGGDQHQVTPESATDAGAEKDSAESEPQLTDLGEDLAPPAKATDQEPTDQPSPEYVPVDDWTASSSSPSQESAEQETSSSAEAAEPPIAPGIPPTPSLPPQMPVGSHLPPSAAPTTAFVQQPPPGMGFQQGVPPAEIPENPYARNRHQSEAPQQPAWQSPLAQAPSAKVPPQIAGAEQAPAQQPPAEPQQGVDVPPPPITGGIPVAGGGVAPPPADVPAQLTQPVEPPKQKRRVGLGTLAALMLVAAIGAGGVTGVVLSSRQGTTISALGESPAKRSGLSEPGDVSEVAKNVLPTVVSIYAANANEGGTGSGSIISSDGHVLTNNHVVDLAKDGGTIEVLLNDGSIYEADLVAGDVETDIAVIKIRGVKDLPVITFGDSDEVVVGESVVAVGAPHGLTATVTAGIVSALNRPVRLGADDGSEVFIDAIQTDASINPGNSGGPLVNMQGQLIGVNSIIYSETQGSVGLGFSIPANQASRYADQLIKKRKIDHPKIGVRLDQRYPGPGALIAKVEPNSPAEKAGLTEGDLVIQVGDRRIGETDAIIAAIRALNFGDTVTLKVMNPESKETREVDVTLPEQ